jgi:hypothetical protein
MATQAKTGEPFPADLQSDSRPRDQLHERRPPGRPRKSGHPSGAPPAQHPGIEVHLGGAPTSGTLAQRLLDLEATAAYLNVSPWTVRDLEAGGILRRVRVPLPNGGALRKLLFDRGDLDRLVEAWKEGVA